MNAPNRTRNFHKSAAAKRAKARLQDGTDVILIGAGNGQRLRIQYDNGRQRTVPIKDVVFVEGQTMPDERKQQ